MQYTSLFCLALAAATANAVTTYKVTVGANGQLAYQPNNFQAEVGSFVEFVFFPKNHTVSQSTFSNPCQPLNTTQPQIFSGFIPTAAPGPNAQSFVIRITDQRPIWLYCGQTVGNHCQQGMVAAINAPTTGPNTFENYLALAQSASTPSKNPAGGLQGGVLVAVGGNNNNPTGTGTGTGTNTGGSYTGATGTGTGTGYPPSSGTGSPSSSVSGGSSIDYITSTYVDGTTTYRTIIPTVVPTNTPIQPTSSIPLGGPTSSASVSTPVVVEGEAGKGVVASCITVGLAALGVAWALL